MRMLEQVTIASGASLSDEVKLVGWNLVGVLMPAAWTAADLTFQVAEKSTAMGGTYVNLHRIPAQDGTASAELQWDAAASVALMPDAGSTVKPGGTFLKVRSGTSGSPVNQAADRVLTLVLEK